jgi:PBS lyase HEAT-like repeat
MRRRLQKVAGRLAMSMLAATTLAALSGCPDDPYAPETWAKKLGEPRELDTAVEKLENLGSPKAIKPLGEAWLKQARPPRILQVIIELARPLSKEEAEKKFLTEFPDGRPASWDLALPYLISALQEADETNPRSVDSAVKAADAIGDAGLAEGLDALIEFASRPSTKKMMQAQVAAVRALGNFGSTDRARAVAALIKLVDRDPPPNPRSAKSAEEKRAMAETYQRSLALTGSAIISLGQLRAPEATKVLVLAIYRTPELFGQVRRALSASGSGAVAELRKVLRNEHPEVKQLFKDKKLDKYCGDRGDLPPDQCVDVSARVFYAAIVLGDMYDPASVPDLLAALKEKPAPAYFYDEQPAGTQHGAIFDSIRKIGSDQAAGALMAIWSDSKADIGERLGAISAYAFVAPGDEGVDRLAKIVEDNSENGDLRLEAATTYGRLARGASAIPVMQTLASKYGKESSEDRAKADGEPKKTMDKAAEKVKQARKAREEAKANLEKLTRDPDASADAIRAATDKAAAQEEAFKAADKQAKADSQKFYDLDRNAKLRKGYQRSFQSHIARIEIAIRCKEDLACYAGTLKAKPEDVVAKLGAYIKDFKEWTAEEKQMLVAAQVERGMLELGKRGQKAVGQSAVLLDAVKSDDRIIRQSILLALPKVVKVPCDNCEAKLDEAIKAGAGKSTMTQLTDETEMLRNYFSWAGGRTPTAKPAAAATPAAGAEK